MEQIMMSQKGVPKNEYRLKYIRGLPIFDSPRFTDDNFEAAIDYQPQDGDIIIASFPKTGTTWLQYIILQILSKGKSFPSFNDVMFKEAPFLEMTGPAAIEALKKPKVYKHHLPYNIVKKCDKAKCIYIYRNPGDILVSFYHHTQNFFFDSDIDFNQYVDDFISSNVPYGSYFEHVKSYLSHKEEDNLLILTYEGLHENIKEEILKISKFLGEEYFTELLKEKSLLDKIMKQTSFENMKNNLFYILPDALSNGKGKRQVEFFRKGTTGEGKKLLTSDQQNRLRNVAEKVLEGTEVISNWYLK